VTQSNYTQAYMCSAPCARLANNTCTDRQTDDCISPAMMTERST